MIHPSYVDLMNVVNKEVEEGEQPVINSRYSVVMATAKRARQIIAGDEPMVRVKDKQKPLSIAVDEMNQAQLRILTDEEKADLITEGEEVQVEEEENTENE
ncbi:DNA-directed RNA polymerase subunit omega [Butyrivibrio sp. AE2032]|uniref:DNA-directed RNA polymerase subunit omega n=1 Tax=Butyrivibrio sp. AE2032 TaxID=1458463 RepID=UPI0005536401|nr:DNA-directed RNA polymerase subunit omega [Butyrivibrio sp. AE2032]